MHDVNPVNEDHGVNYEDLHDIPDDAVHDNVNDNDVHDNDVHNIHDVHDEADDICEYDD